MGAYRSPKTAGKPKRAFGLAAAGQPPSGGRQAPIRGNQRGTLALYRR